MTLEYKCPECGDWSPADDWKETSVYCDDCGDHPGLVCPKCEDDVDLIFNDLQERMK